MLKRLTLSTGRFFLILALLVSCMGILIPQKVYAGTGGTIYPSRTGYYFFTIDGSTYRVDLSISTEQVNTHYLVSQSLTKISGSSNIVTGINSQTWTYSDTAEFAYPDLYDPGDREYRLRTVITFSKPGYHPSGISGNGVQSTVESYTDTTATFKISTNDCGITNWYDSSGNFLHNTLNVSLAPNTYTMTSYHYKWYNGSWVKFNTTTANANYDTTYTPSYVSAPTGYKKSSRDYDSGWKVTGNKTFSLYYQPNSYTETLKGNGGTMNGSSDFSASVTYDSTDNSDLSSQAKAMSRTGYTFTGWYTSASGGTQVYKSSGKVTNEGTYWTGSRWHYTGNLTLYAHWTPNNYTLYYNSNSGSCSTSSKTVTYDSTIGSMATASKTHYSFLGWFTSASGGSQWTSSTKYTTAGNSTVYAHWELAECVTTFDSQGGSTVSSRTDPVTGTYSNLATSVRPGWDFQGWFTQPNGQGSKVQNGTEVPDIEYTTVYAYWTVHVSTVTLNATVPQSTVLYPKGFPIVSFKITGTDVSGQSFTFVKNLTWSSQGGDAKSLTFNISSGNYIVTVLNQNEYSAVGSQNIDTSQGNNSTLAFSRSQTDWSKYTGNNFQVGNLK